MIKYLLNEPTISNINYIFVSNLSQLELNLSVRIKLSKILLEIKLIEWIECVFVVIFRINI